MRFALVVVLVGCAHAPEPAVVTPDPDMEPEAEPQHVEERTGLPCSWLPEGTALYRAAGEADEEGYVPYTLIGGASRVSEDMRSDGDFALAVREIDVNGDELADFYGEPGPDPWCSSYDGCVRGLYVGCDDDVLAELWPPDVPAPSTSGTFVVIDGVRWFDLMVFTRGASVPDEAADEDEGLTAGSATMYRMGDDRSYRAWPEAEQAMAAACRQRVDASEPEQARPFCRNAASLARTVEGRGRLEFALAQIAEALGDLNAAREHYENALNDLPDEEAAIEQRLSELPEREK